MKTTFLSACCAGLLATGLSAFACGGSANDFTTDENGEQADDDNDMAGDGDGDSGGDGDAPVGDGDGDVPATVELCPGECERLTGPACPEYTREQCDADCEFITRLPDCQREYQAYFDCSEGKTVECNEQGDPVVPGCQLQLGIALLCAWGSVPNQNLEPKCDDYCASVEETCGEGNPDCSLNCQTAGTEGTGCQDLWEGHLDCVAESEELSCPLGLFAAGCGESYWEWLACLNE